MKNLTISIILILLVLGFNNKCFPKIKCKELVKNRDNIFFKEWILSFEQYKQDSSFTDSRDGKTYKTVKIDNQTWMAENLNYSTDNTLCYENDSSNCIIYGRLYDWNTAKKACPSGWHLPSISEYETLLNKVGGSGSNAYNALKKDGKSGFNALLGGWCNKNGYFSSIEKYGYWWSSSASGTGKAWSLYISSSSMKAYVLSYDKTDTFSVRCLHD